jgi:hypothetical protein
LFLPPLGPRGEETLACGEWDTGEPISDEGADTLVLYVIVGETLACGGGDRGTQFRQRGRPSGTLHVCNSRYTIIPLHADLQIHTETEDLINDECPLYIIYILLNCLWFFCIHTDLMHGYAGNAAIFLEYLLHVCLHNLKSVEVAHKHPATIHT